MTEADRIRLDTYRNRLMQYYEAETKILEGQSYSIGSRSLSRANLAEVRNAIKDLEGQIQALSTRGTTKRVVARFIPKDY